MTAPSVNYARCSDYPCWLTDLERERDLAWNYDVYYSGTLTFSLSSPNCSYELPPSPTSKPRIGAMAPEGSGYNRSLLDENPYFFALETLHGPLVLHRRVLPVLIQ